MVDLVDDSKMIDERDFVLQSDDVHIKARDYPMLSRTLKQLQNKQATSQLSQAQSIKLLYEARHWLSTTIHAMDLHSKDIFIVIGPSRTGKGTLLEALKGANIQFINKQKHSAIKFVASSELSNFMSPV